MCPDLGFLCAMLYQFENRVGLFPNARFKEENGEAVLVVQVDRGSPVPTQPQRPLAGLGLERLRARARRTGNARAQQVARDRALGR
jgi:hypothetical protein